MMATVFMDRLQLLRSAKIRACLIPDASSSLRETKNLDPNTWTPISKDSEIESVRFLLSSALIPAH
jgi:hypothetical protein